MSIVGLVRQYLGAGKASHLSLATTAFLSLEAFHWTPNLYKRLLRILLLPNS